MKDDEKDNECQAVLNRLYREQELRLEDNKFHMIALNLSGKRQQLEKLATELINKHGILPALKISKVYPDIKRSVNGRTK